MVLLSGIPGAETEKGRRDAATGFMYLFFRSVHSIALRKRQCLHENQAGMSPHNISNDLDKAVLIVTAAFQTSLGGRKKHRFLGPGLASHPRCSRDPERKTHAGRASVATEEQFPTHPLANCQHSKAGAACPGGQVTNGTKRTAAAAGLLVTSRHLQLQALGLSFPFC